MLEEPIEVLLSFIEAWNSIKINYMVAGSIAPGRIIFIGSPEDIVLAKLDWYRQGNEVS